MTFVPGCCCTTTGAGREESDDTEEIVDSEPSHDKGRIPINSLVSFVGETRSLTGMFVHVVAWLLELCVF